MGFGYFDLRAASAAATPPYAPAMAWMGHCAVMTWGLFAELVVVAQFRLNQPPKPLQSHIKIGAMEQAVTQRQLLDEIHP